ncbi:Mitochondrial ATPase complex subunit atp10 [Gnomoniopsis sp. IMI 355080]|nr:Mitochondrial ATPase complex subunit atp10 [Gnomoniopsis sp. IMI 355080]
MLEQMITRSFLRPSRRTLAPCIRCQWRAVSNTHPRLAGSKPQVNQPPTNASPSDSSKQAVPVSTGEQAPPAPEPSPLENAPRRYGRRVDQFEPTPLLRPIGMQYPPKAGQNTGIDLRTRKQKRDDFVNWEKHLKRRAELKEQMIRPYFRDWKNLDLHHGKTFIAPPRLFKHDKSLYFPNLFGQTLLKNTSLPRDTTPVLQGKASVVTLYSSTWAESQADSFMSEKANPDLHEILKAHKGHAQLVRVNIEDQSRLRYWILRFIARWLRKNYPEEAWGKYFMVRAGISDEIRESIGYLNSKVGYIYLVDGDCKIRWAGSGPAKAEEVQSLTKGMRTLITEMKKGVWGILK